MRGGRDRTPIIVPVTMRRGRDGTVVDDRGESVAWERNRNRGDHVPTFKQIRMITDLHKNNNHVSF